MELVIISPEGERPDEQEVAAELLSAGLARYHVRKPGWDEDRLRRWLEAAPEDMRSKCVLHSHHALVEQFGLRGTHWPESSRGHALHRRAGSDFISTSCHSLADVRECVGRYDSVFYSPVFASDSKPGRAGLTAADLSATALFLVQRVRSAGARQNSHLKNSAAATDGLEGGQRTAAAGMDTQVIALSGITPERVGEVARLGFDGIAVMGGVWGADGLAPAAEVLARFGRYRAAVAAVTGAIRTLARALHPIMCLTMDGDSRSHVEQARALCAAGAKLIQLRCKGLDDAAWLAVAREVVAICHAHGAVCLVNDRPDLAVAAGADGAHVGKNDLAWPEARRVLGRDRLLGGTVNNEDDARRAVAAGCLDYVGVGPWRFTTTKQKLSPVLGPAGVTHVIAALGDLPAWVIGGITADDLPAVHATGAAGAAISSVLYRDHNVAAQYLVLENAWPVGASKILSAV